MGNVSSKNTIIDVTNGAAHVVTESGQAVVNSYFAFSDLTDTEQYNAAVDDATIVTIKFTDLGSAVATVAYVAFNSANDAGDDTALADDTLRVEIPLGGSATLYFPSATPLIRVGAKSNDPAPVGGSNSLSFVFSRPA